MNDQGRPSLPVACHGEQDYFETGQSGAQLGGGISGESTVADGDSVSAAIARPAMASSDNRASLMIVLFSAGLDVTRL
jgi:hypothetical protein